MSVALPLERIQRKIFFIRSQKVMLDVDLAELYGVPTKRLNEQVRRNRLRFPADFMFQLTYKEAEEMRSNIGGTHKRNIRHRPLAFSEHGVAMLSSVLNSERAIKTNIAIVRAFIRLREVLLSQKSLALKINELENQINKHGQKFKKHAKQINQIFEAIWRLMNGKKEPIGFKT